MRSVFRSRLGRTSITAILAGLAVLGIASSANAYDGYWRGHEWRGHYWPHHEWRGHYYGGWNRPYYYAPPVVTYPPAYGYYGPQGLNLNFNVPL